MVQRVLAAAFMLTLCAFFTSMTTAQNSPNASHARSTLVKTGAAQLLPPPPPPPRPVPPGSNPEYKGYGLFRSMLVESVNWPTGEFPPTPKPTQYIVTHLATQLLNKDGPASIVASCSPGDQMLGGGFKIDAGNGYGPPIGDVDRFVAANNGNYPSGPSTWTGSYVVNDWNAHKHTYLTPDMKPNNVRNNELFAYVAVYCLTAANYSLDIVQVTADRPQASGYNSTFASCPPNSVLTGGGFQVQPGDYYMLLATSPTVGSNNFANGWAARVWGSADLKVYALCARHNLQAIAAAVDVIDQTNPAIAISEHKTTADCPENGVTTGGGFNIGGWQYDNAGVPAGSAFYDSWSPGPGYSRWATKILSGYQTTQYNLLPCQQTTQCVTTALAIACFKMPDIPRIYVSIVQPQTGTHFPTARNTGRSAWTNEVVLAAVATDAQGNVLPNARLSWDYVGGEHIGDGRVLKGRFGAGGAVIERTIRVTATDHGLTAVNAVKISTGTVL